MEGRGEKDRIRRERLRGQALDRAAAIVAAEGAAALNVRRIAQEIGCAVGTVYNLFDDLGHLLAQLNLRTLAAMETALRTAHEAARDAPADQRLRVLARAYLAFVRAHPRRWAAALDGETPAPPDERAEQHAIGGRLIALATADVAELLPPDTLHDAQKQATLALWTGIEGVSRLVVSETLEDIRLGIEGDAVLETQLSLLIAGMRMQGPPAA